jgi:hypothetical protein
MASENQTVPIQSFRVCFNLERRIHKIDRWRLPLPYGLPLRSIGYFGVLLALILFAQQLPVIGAATGMLHPSLRYVAIPVGFASVLTRWRVDGRLPHRAGLAWLRHQTAPARVASFRAAPAPGPVQLAAIAFAPDERCARLRRGIVEGPANVVIRYGAQLRPRGRTLHVRPTGGRPLWRGKHVAIGKGQRLVVR